MGWGGTLRNVFQASRHEHVHEKEGRKHTFPLEKSFLTAQNVEHGGAYLKTRGKGGGEGEKKGH